MAFLLLTWFKTFFIHLWASIFFFKKNVKVPYYNLCIIEMIFPLPFDTKHVFLGSHISSSKCCRDWSWSINFLHWLLLLRRLWSLIFSFGRTYFWFLNGQRVLFWFLNFRASNLIVHYTFSRTFVCCRSLSGICIFYFEKVSFLYLWILILFSALEKQVMHRKKPHSFPPSIIFSIILSLIFFLHFT